MNTPFRLEHTLLGCATSATQIEGSPTSNNWYDWAGPGKTKDGASPRNACRHWDRWQEDNQLIAGLGLQVYRMSLEWSRIEPQQGRFCRRVMDRYRAEIADLQRRGVQVLLTLHHFTNPTWLEAKGGFTNPDCVPAFLHYVDYVVENLGDLVTDYVTINEPNVYCTMSYFFGVWPPQLKNPFRAIKAMRHLALCHLAAYRHIHRIRAQRHFPGRTMVGFAEHMRVFAPATDADRPLVDAMHYLFESLMDVYYTGQFYPPIGSDAPFGVGRFYDYIGINYYTRCWMRGVHIGTKPGYRENDLGWEIYPEGLHTVMRHRYKRYVAPIWITENGVADKQDRLRPQFLYDHLRQIADSSLPVERYYHWSLLDNFEWAEGESAAFGLVACDFKTQQRTLRPSALFYKEIIQNRGVTQDMINRYLVK